MDGALDAVYGDRAAAGWAGRRRPSRAGSASCARTSRAGVVRVVQQDAIDRLGLHRLLLEPEVLESVTPDVHLAATLMSLRDALPEASRQVARRRRPRRWCRTSSAGSPTAPAPPRAARWTAARALAGRGTAEIDWDRTIRANLRHYQPEHRRSSPSGWSATARRRRSLAAELILVPRPEREHGRLGRPRRRAGGRLASLPTLQTRVIAFDTAVVDLTDELGDPVDVLFGIQLGGGTDIDQALGYCQTLVVHPAKTVLILVTDLYEGGDQDSMLRRAASLLRSGVRLIVLLALSDDGAPGYDHGLAAHVAALGAPVFACTPDQFPDMLAAALEGRDVNAWAADEDINVA